MTPQTRAIERNTRSAIGFAKRKKPSLKLIKISPNIGQVSRNQVRRKPSFSDTRFVAYSGTALKNFITNYPYIYERLNNLKNNNLDKTNTAFICLCVSALADTYTELGIISKTVHSPQLYTWHSDDAIYEGIRSLKNMATSVLISNEPNHPRFTFFRAACEEIRSSSEFRGKPVHLKQHTSTSLRSHTDNTEYHDRPTEACITAP